MSSVPLRDFIVHLSVCSEKAACIARHIRFMQTDFNSMIQEKQCNGRRWRVRLSRSSCLPVLVDENHQHLDADYKTLA